MIKHISTYVILIQSILLLHSFANYEVSCRLSSYLLYLDIFIVVITTVAMLTLECEFNAFFVLAFKYALLFAVLFRFFPKTKFSVDTLIIPMLILCMYAGWFDLKHIYNCTALNYRFLSQSMFFTTLLYYGLCYCKYRSTQR